MEHDERKKRSFILTGLAGTINAGGKALVFSFDACASGMGKTCSLARKSATTIMGLSPPFKSDAKKKSTQVMGTIRRREEQLNILYHELGKKIYAGTDTGIYKLEEPIIELWAEIWKIKSNIEQLKKHLTVMVGSERAEKLMAFSSREKALQFTPEETGIQEIPPEKMKLFAAMGEILKTASFSSEPDRVLFKTVAMDLLDTQVEIRALAAAELVKTQNPSVIPLFLAVLSAGDSELAPIILTSLVQMSPQTIIPEIVEKVLDPNTQIRMAALDGLETLLEQDWDFPPSLSEKLTNSLIELSLDKNADIRASSVYLLGLRPEAKVVTALITCLTDKSEIVRVAAINALRGFRDASILMPLMDRLGDKNSEIREVALTAVSEISGEEIVFDVKAKKWKRKKALSILKKSFRERNRMSADGTKSSLPSGKDKTIQQKESADDDKETVGVDAPLEIKPHTEAVDKKTPAPAAPRKPKPGTETVEKNASVQVEPLEIKQDKEAVEEIQAVAASPVKPETAGTKLEEPKVAVPNTDGACAEAPKTEPLDNGAPPKEHSVLNRENLRKMVKPQLITLCKHFEVDFDFSDSRIQLISRLLEIVEK